MKSIIRFLASLRLAIVLFILLASASILGTLVPQGRSAAEYAARYGGLAGPLRTLRITDLYHSGWFLGLLLLFAANIAACSLIRLGPKFRRLRHPHVESSVRALAAMTMRDSVRRPESPTAASEALEKRLAARNYRVRTAAVDGAVHVLGRKRRLGWFGADVVHAGVLIILAGGLISGLAGFRTSLVVKEGETVDVPRAGYGLRLDEFATEYHPGGGIKDWKSRVSVVAAPDESSMAASANEAPAAAATIEVNHPLTHRGYTFYQMSYGQDWSEPSLKLTVGRAGGGAEGGVEADRPNAAAQTIRLARGERVAVEAEAVTHVVVAEFLPDFVMDEDRRIRSRSNEPNNPAALVEVWRGEERVYATWVFANYPDFRALSAGQEPELTFRLTGWDAPSYSVLEVVRDPGTGWIWAGCAVLMLGLFLAFYWPPREIRAVCAPAGQGVEITAAAAASKSRAAAEAEFRAMMEDLRRPR